MKTITSIVKSITVGAVVYFFVVGALWALEKIWELTIGTIQPGTVVSYILDVVIVVIILLLFWGVGNVVRNR